MQQSSQQCKGFTRFSRVNFSYFNTKKLSQLALLFVLLSSSFWATAQISGFVPSSTPVSKCSDGSLMTLNVGTTGTLVITMPVGISYVTGSITGATEVSATANTATFAVAAAGVVTYKHTASCSVDEMLTFIDNARLNTGSANPSGSYNVAEATPQVTSVVNAPIVANVGQAVTKTVTVTNGGIGTVMDWYYQEVSVSGAYVINPATITFGGNLLPVSNVNLTTGGGFDTLTIHFTAAQMLLIGDNDRFFDGNFGGGSPEAFNIVYTVLPIVCGTGYAINSSHRTFFGCADLCSDVSFSSLLDLNIPTPPNLAYAHAATMPACVDGSVPIPSQLKITNTGGPASNFVMNFGNVYAYAAPSYGYPSMIDTATFRYRVNGGPLQRVTFTNVFTNKGGTWFGSSNCGLENGVSQFDFQIPFIPAGAVITFDYNFYKCCSSNPVCPAGNSSYYDLQENYLYCRYGSYKNACGDLSYAIPAIYFNYNGITYSAALDYPSDMVNNQVENFKTTITGSNYLVTTPSAYYEIITTLPSGYSMTGAAPYASSGIYNWAGVTTQTGNVITTRFNYPLPANFDVSYFKYNLNLTFLCADYTGGSATILQNHKFVADPSCACVRNLVCVQNAPLLHCPSPCPEGINNLFASALRKNYGAPDLNNDGVADAGPHNYALMATKTMMWGDTVEYTNGGTIAWIAANGAFTNMYAESSVNNFAGKFSVVDADVALYRAGVLVSPPTIYPTTVSGNIVRTDFSALAGIIQQGDSIVKRLRTRFIDPAFIQANTASIEYTSLNYMYASRVVNPVGADRKYCDAWAGTILAEPYYYTYGGSSATVTGCDQTYLVNYQYLSIGQNGTNNYYQKSTRFPYEVRQWGHVNKSNFYVPASYGYSVDSVQVHFYRTAGTTYAAYYAYTVPFTYVNDTAKVDIKRLYKEFGGNAANPVGDDGWQVNTLLFISATCKTAIAPSFVGYGFNMKSYDNHLPTGPIVEYPISYNYYTVQSTPVQLVGGGGGVKNIAGRSFNYPNVVVSNQTNSTSRYGYVYFTNTANSNITKIIYGGVTITPDANGYYNIGGFAAGQSKTLSVFGTTTACTAQTLKMYFGWDCRGIPTAVPTAATQCAPPLTFILKPLSAKIDGTVTPLASTPPNPATGVGVFGSTSAAMCETFPVEIVINSALQGTIYDVLANTKIPAGLTYEPGSAYFETPSGTAPMAVSAAQEAALVAAGTGGILPFDLQQMSSNAIDSLQGTVANPASVRKLIIRFLLRPNCTYDGKGRVRATLLANRGCGAIALNNGTIKSGSTLKLTPPAGTFAVTVVPSISPINGCGIASTGSLTINKTDAIVPTSSDSISMTVPMGVDISNITCAACSPALTAPTVVTDGTSRTLSWAYPVGNVTGTIVINFDASANAAATCGNPQEVAATVSQVKNIYCSTISGNCPGALSIDAAEAFANFNINLPTFSITAMTAGLYSTATPSDYNVTATINNTSAVNSNGFKLVYAYDVDGDGFITAADNILFTDNITTPLMAGASTTINKNFYTNIPAAGADIIIGILPLNADPTKGTCACDDAYATATPTVLASSSLGNYVWNDTNKNGLQDANEVGVAGITVILYNSVGTAIATTKTDAFGKYLFTDLVPGDYTVGFTLPINYVFTEKGSGTDSGTATDSDVNPANSRTGIISLGLGENERNVDAGIYFATPITQSIGDYVWVDANNSGTQDGNEKGMAGVTVTLYDNTGKVVAVTTTDGNGKYLFSDLPTGTYTVGFGAMPGFSFTTTTAGTANGSDADATTGRTAPIVLNAGDNRRDIDAGFVANAPTKGALGNRVWNDTNNDGIQDPSEAGVAGVIVNLLDVTGAIIATTTTDANGNYLFNNLDAGRYKVEFVPASLPAGFVFTNPNTATGAGNDANDSDADATSGKTGWYTLGAGEKNLSIDAGIYNATPRGGLGDFVWIDANKDGIQDPSEAGLAGVTVTLYAADGVTVVATTVTDITGHYAFNNLPAANYIVGFSNLPEGYVFTNTTTGTTTGSDANQATGRTAPIAVGTTFVSDIDAGVYPSGTASGTGSIGNLVWYDTDGNGIQNASEVGVAGVTVTLYNAAGTAIATTTTDALGHYLFTGLAKGDYTVGFSNLPAGYNLVSANAGGNDATDSDADVTTGRTATISLAQGEDNFTVDAGIRNPTAPLGAIGSFVWNDANGDGIQNDGATSGFGGIDVTLYDAEGKILRTTTTDANGYYLFPDLPMGSYTVGFSNLPAGYNLTSQTTGNATGSDANPTTGRTPTITLTNATPTNLDIDAGVRSTTTAALGDYVWLDTNGDGIQDASEKPLGGVLVTLYAADGVTKIASTITDANGYYSFLNLNTNIDYVVGFDNLPLGTTFTTQTTGTANGSDVNPLTGKTPLIHLTPGEFNTSIDAGVTPQKAGLGNYVWLDANGNGLQDANEMGVAGVIVNLYDNSGNLVAKTITDSEGFYSFNNLTPGTYSVEFQPTSLPKGAVFTSQTTGTTNGSDANTSTGFVNSITLAPGEFNSSIDAGIQQNTASIGDFTWIDTNKDGIQDPSELPLGGVPVTLYAADGITVVATTTTDAKGFYLFENLPAGDYVVGFGTVPSYTRTTPSGMIGGSPTGETPLLNSDADALTGKTSLITVLAGQRNTTIDAGYYITTLPVKLISFSATTNDCEVNLSWATASEQNSRTFEVWNSEDGKNYTKVSEVRAAGNSNTTQNYQFTDTKPNRTNYYKLVQTDLDGSTETYNMGYRITTAGCFTDANDLIFPNPNATNQVFVQFHSEDTQTATITIYDQLGRTLQTTSVTPSLGYNTITLDIKALPQGAYTVKIQTSQVKATTHKFIRIAE
jgi:SdrD B-like domain/Secretion system C-terminal sorting domain